MNIREEIRDSDKLTELLKGILSPQKSHGVRRAFHSMRILTDFTGYNFMKF